MDGQTDRQNDYENGWEDVIKRDKGKECVVYKSGHTELGGGGGRS